MKSLREEVEEIKHAKMSRTAKKEAFIKLGLMVHEVAGLMASLPKAEGTPRQKFTFGVEIECGVRRGALRDVADTTGFRYQYEGYNHNDGHAHFKFVTDASLDSSLADGNPIECVSPVLEGTLGRETLEVACRTLNEAGAAVNRSCGLHVHIGAPNMASTQYANIFVNYAHLEPLIDSFMAPSRRNNQYAKTLRGSRMIYLREATTIGDVHNALSHDRYYKVNPLSLERHGTIEFRQHQGTTNFGKIYHWVMFCARLVAWSAKHRLDATPATIDDIPFLTKAEKMFFKTRVTEMKRAAESVSSHTR